MNVNLYVIEDYENETTFRLQKNKANQSLSCLPSVALAKGGACAQGAQSNGPISNGASTHGQQELQKIFDLVAGGR